MTVSQPSQDPNKDAATAAWELQVTQTANQIQHQIDNIQESVTTSQPQVAIYSHTQDGTIQSFDPPASGDGFVTYFNYTDGLPTLPVAGLTFSAFSDEELDYEIEQYRETANRPTNPGTVSYVINSAAWSSSSNWTKTKPAMAGTNVWISKARIVGAAGQTVVAKWSNPSLLYGGQIAQGILYYNTAATSAPSAPTATDYDFKTGVFTGLTSGWQYVPITTAMGGGTTISHKHWQISFHVEVSETTLARVITFGTVEGVIPIGTTLQSDNFSSGSAGWQIVRNTGNAEFNNVTVRGSLNADDITAGTLAAARIATTALDADNINAGTLSATRISGGTLNISGLTSLTGQIDAPNLNTGVIMNATGGPINNSLNGNSSVELTAVGSFTTMNDSAYDTDLILWANAWAISVSGGHLTTLVYFTVDGTNILSTATATMSGNGQKALFCGQKYQTAKNKEVKAYVFIYSDGTGLVQGYANMFEVKRDYGG